MKKGFIGVVLLVLVAAASVAFAGYEYYQAHQIKLGSSIQTQLTDTLGTFRTNVNTNFTNIDSEIASITSTQAGYGNIVSQNTPLAVGSGGTGMGTSPSDAQFLSASDSIPTWKSVIFGGGLLTTTTPTSVSISAAGFNTADNYNLTGIWTFSTATSTAPTSTDSVNLIPAGVIEMYATSSAPAGWLLCDGSSYATSTYPRLFTMIRYVYGGSGANFNVPDLRGRFAAGPGGSLSTTLGTTGGATSVAITTSNLPLFTPTIISGASQILGGSGGSTAFQSVGASGGFSFTFNSYGTSSPSNISTVSPYIILNYIIKY